MASLILACITCCHPQNRHGKFLAAPTIPKHKRHTRNPSTTMSISTTPRTTPTAGSGNRTMSGNYTFEALKIENERRVRKLAEAGVMDVPHGVLSKEVGTPEVVPRYGDVVVEAWEREGPGEGVGKRSEDEANGKAVEGPRRGDSPRDREEEMQSAPMGQIQPPQRAHVVGERGAAVR
ncbi:hypothetical protein EV426DRAFT_577265 [Tirmania nivea]|nr:hypothetical protein EV426DRAFT_577265 [Tirmania nivea]